MKYIIIVLVIIFIFCNSPLIMACSSFCVYSNKALYGMNFDFPDTEIKLTIQTYEDMKIFHMQFESEGTFISSVGMNNKGLFCSEQELWPYVYNFNPKKNNEIYIWDLYNYALLNLHNTNQIIKYISDKQLIHSHFPSLHLLAGDMNSNAAIIEVGKNNEITLVKNKFIVMTNFRNADFLNHPYGVGEDRYKTACKYISNNIQNFDFNHGIETLKKITQSEGPYQTLCSMLFSPTENAVYIMLRKNFNQIWKLSINQNTIETFKGFDQYQKIILDSSGILVSDISSI
ncbi:hypothetical protein [Desulfobacula sp.]